jgi:L-seryl-tRNA(Ser) seleniumtransferase
MGIYEQLGVQPLINAQGCVTRIGGSIMSPQVLEAMAEASRQFVDVIELNREVGKRIAQLMGAQSAHVSAGGASGVLLATAALLTGTDPGKIRRLPDTIGMKNQVITHRSHRHVYDNMVTAAGAKLVEIGWADRAFPWELEQAINDQTVGVFYTVSPVVRDGIPLPEVIRIAHKRDVPVYVDCASMLPPATNLRRWLDLGVDMVVFSGGKGIMGPQSTGIIAGRKDLIEAASLNSAPNHAVGRAAKVSREEIVGLLVALEAYVQRDHEADYGHWKAQAQQVADRVNALSLPGVSASVVFNEETEYCSQAYITINKKKFGATAEEVRNRVENGEPRIATGIHPKPREVIINPHMLQEGEVAIVIRRITEVLTEMRNE